MNDHIVIGLDTDSKGFHWVSNRLLWDGSGDSPNQTYVGYAISKAELESRRATSFLVARSFFADLPPDHEVHVFCEEPLALKNGKTTRILGLAAGAIWAAFIQAGGLREHWYWYWVDVAHWKKEVVGRGNSSKDEIREFVRDNPAWGSLARDSVFPDTLTLYDDMFEGNHNLYDAWCLKVYGVRQLAGRGIRE